MVLCWKPRALLDPQNNPSLFINVLGNIHNPLWHWKRTETGKFDGSSLPNSVRQVTCDYLQECEEIKQGGWMGRLWPLAPAVYISLY